MPVFGTAGCCTTRCTAAATPTGRRGRPQFDGDAGSSLAAQHGPSRRSRRQRADPARSTHDWADRGVSVADRAITDRERHPRSAGVPQPTFPKARPQASAAGGIGPTLAHGADAARRCGRSERSLIRRMEVRPACLLGAAGGPRSQNFADPGRHRHREHPPVQRAAHEDFESSAADRDRRRAQGDQ